MKQEDIKRVDKCTSTFKDHDPDFISHQKDVS